MSEVFCWERRVEFCETDAAGIAHFSALCVYMEQAEHALFRSFGHSVYPQSDDSHPTWPRVHIELDFHAPARFEDVLSILIRIERLGTKSVSYLFEIKRDQTLVATGKVTNVCCIRTTENGHEALKSVAIPESIRMQLSRFTV